MIFNKGDNVVCVDVQQDDLVDGESRFNIQSLTLYDNYTVNQCIKVPTHDRYIIMLQGIKYTIFEANRFVSISEFRKRKINKLINKI